MTRATHSSDSSGTTLENKPVTAIPMSSAQRRVTRVAYLESYTMKKYHFNLHGQFGKKLLYSALTKKSAPDVVNNYDKNSRDSHDQI
jgi:hypothetical protein